MALDKDTVARIARLARLKVPDEELAPLAVELSGIFAWIEQLNEVDTRNVEPLSSVSLCAVLLSIAACGPGVKGGPTMNSKVAAQPYQAAKSGVVSDDILAREPVANTALVRHILISSVDMADNFNGHQDPRAAARNKEQAETEVKGIVEQLQAGGDFEAIMKEKSEDLGSAKSNQPFTVKPDSGLVIEFRQLSLRLNPGEYGVCQSDFGFHIIKRYE